MGRHYKQKHRAGIWLTLLVMLLITAAAAFTVRSMPSARTGDDRAVSLQADDKQLAVSHDEAIREQVTGADDAVSAGQSEKTAAKSLYSPMPDVPYAPPYGTKPLLALIVDDGGYQLDLTKRVAALDLPLTWAIIPYSGFAAETARLAGSKQIPYLLHLPMQAQSDKDGSKAYIVGRGMTREQIRDVTAKALDSLPGVIGLNNHRGSLATSSGEIMDPVIEVLKERGLMFVDSRTSAKSVAYDAAAAKGVPALRNRGFLDGSPERAEIEKRFNEAIRLAEKRGSAIAICHFRPTTVTFLELLYLRKDTLPVRLVTIPEMSALLNTVPN